MISNRLYMVMGLAIPLGYNLGLFNFSWNPSNRHLKPTQKSKNLYKLNTAFCVIWVAFVAVQMCYQWHMKNYGSVILVFPFVIGGILALLTMAMLAGTDGTPIFVTGSNAFLFYLSRINRLYLPRLNPNTSKFIKIVDAIIFSMGVFLVLMIIFSCIPCILFPQLPAYFGNVLPTGTPLLIRIVIIFYHCYICLPLYTPMVLDCCAVILYGFLAMPFFSKELPLGRKSYKSISKLRTLDTLIIEYRAAQLLQNISNEIFGPFLVPFQSGITLLFMMASFIVIRHWDRINPFSLLLMISWAVIAPFVWIVVLMAGAYLFRTGNKIINSWKYHQKYMTIARERKLLGKFRASCRPLCISHKKFYTIRSISAMVFTRGLIKGLMRTLLTLKSN